MCWFIHQMPAVAAGPDLGAENSAQVSRVGDKNSVTGAIPAAPREHVSMKLSLRTELALWNGKCTS